MQKKAIEKFYSEKGYYKWTQSSFEHDRLAKINQAVSTVLSTKKRLNVLDVGSGTGDYIYQVFQNFPHHNYFGCDIADSVIKSNKKNKKEINWAIEDFNNKISYKDNFFDLLP